MVLLRRMSRRRRAGGFLEFALIMPFFLALIMIVFDVGTLILFRSQVVNAAYSSARQAAQYGAFGTPAEVTKKVAADLLKPVGPLPASTLTVTPSSNQADSTVCTETATELRSTVTYQMPLPFDFFGLVGTKGASGPNTILITGQGVARCEVVR